MDVQLDDEQDRTQRHKEPALGTLRWVKPAEGPGYIFSLDVRGKVRSRLLLTSCGQAARHRFDGAAAREMRERVRGVSAIAHLLARRRSGAGSASMTWGLLGKLLKRALQPLSPEPQPGPS